MVKNNSLTLPKKHSVGKNLTSLLYSTENYLMNPMNDIVKLFAVYLGGRAPRSNIELHDVVFVAGTSLKETYPKLKEKWFGYPEKTPHIDSYIELNHADGFQICLKKGEEPQDNLKLYFVNYGAYTENLFGEVHQSAFYVAKSKAEATRKAEKDLCVGMIQTHLDDHLEVEGLVEFGQFDIDDVLEINHIDGYYLEFTPSEIKETSLANPGYLRLQLKETIIANM